MQSLLLEDCLNDLAVIRTTFETLDIFPADDPIRDEIMEIVFDARNNLNRSFSALCLRLEANQAPFLWEYEKFKTGGMKMITQGFPIRILTYFWKYLADFNEDEALYFYKVTGYEDVAILKQMPAYEFTVVLFKDVLHGIRDKTNYADAQSFNQNVCEKYMAITFLCYSTTDPLFYNIHE